MNTYDICFERLIHQFEPLIANECAGFRGVFSNEELRATALLGLWYADVTYEKGICAFDTYVRRSIQRSLKCYITKSRLGGSLFSLNRNLDRNTAKTAFIDVMPAPTADWDTALMIRVFVSKLESPLNSIAYDLLGKATVQDIMADYQLSQQEVERTFSQLCCMWMEQYGYDVENYLG